MARVKAGVLLQYAEWFDQLGITGSRSGIYAQLGDTMRRDIDTILETLNGHFEVIYPGPIFSSETAEAAAKAFKANDIDVAVVVSVMWSSDGPLLEVLKTFADVPILLWCYNPSAKLPARVTMSELFRSSGIVGVLQQSAPMKRLGMKFSFVYGSPGDRELEKELGEYARVFETAREMKSLRIGQLGPRCECMTGTYVDEFRLLSKLGPKLVPIAAHRLYEESLAVSEKETEDYVRQIKSRYAVNGVSDMALHDAARATLAVERIAEREGLGAIAIEDLNPELHRLLKTRPCLWTDRLTEKKFVMSAEGDVISALGMWVARHLGESTPMYTEIFTCDSTENALLMGHAAMHDVALAGGNEVTVVPDFEYMESDESEGAWLHFSARPGPVTIVGTFADVEDYRMFVFTGEVLDAGDKLEGYPHAYVKVKLPLAEFFKTAVQLGMTQHFAISYDPIGDILEKFCRVTGIQMIKL